MVARKIAKSESPFAEDELRDRISEAFARAIKAPRFREFRYGMDRLTKEQKDFVELWVEEALRAAKRPTWRQSEAAKNEKEAEDRLHLFLTDTQARELTRILHETEEPIVGPNRRRRIPLATYRVLHSKGLVSTNQHLTEMGARVVHNILQDRGTTNRSTK